MAYTNSDIRRIHSSATATHKQKYTTTSGEVYIGLSNGRLKKINYAEQAVSKQTDSNTNDIESILEEISELKDSYTLVLEEAAKAKCFNIAMSIIL